MCTIAQSTGIWPYYILGWEGGLCSGNKKKMSGKADVNVQTDGSPEAIKVCLHTKLGMTASAGEWKRCYFPWEYRFDLHLFFLYAASGGSVLCQVCGQDRVPGVRCGFGGLCRGRAGGPAGDSAGSFYGDSLQHSPVCYRQRADRGAL